MKARAPSPSAKLARLSRRLTKKASSTSMHASMPLGSHSHTIRRVSEAHRNVSHSTKPQYSRPCRGHGRAASFSGDSSSTFSCAGDLLPDEMGGQPAMQQDIQDDSPASYEMSELCQIAKAVSRQRSISEESVVPKIMQLFTNHNEMKQQSTHGTASTASAAHTMARKPSQLMGFINKLKPQLALDTVALGRRFSFEVGDDTVPLPPPPSSAAVSRESLLRTSVSLPALLDTASKQPSAKVQDNASSTRTSPAKSTATNDSRRPSKIPSPLFHGVLAKPRGSGSRSSSIYSTQSTVRLDADHQDGSADLSSQETARMQVVDHTNVLRSGAAAAAARAASNASLQSIRGQHSSQRKHWDTQPRVLDSSRSEYQHMSSRSGDGAKENRPLLAPASEVGDDDDPESASSVAEFRGKNSP